MNEEEYAEMCMSASEEALDEELQQHSLVEPSILSQGSK